MKVRLTFTAPLLGTVSGNQEVAKAFIINKVLKDKSISEKEALKRTAEEEKTLPSNVEEVIEDSSTYFHRDEEGNPFLYGYMIKGFFKAACDAMIDSGQFTKEKLKEVNLGRYSYKRTINKLITITSRRMMLQMPVEMKRLEGEIKKNDDGFEFIERSLRAETMRGDRICLARSEAAPEGTVTEFDYKCLNKKLEPYIEWWLDYGKDFGGIGQWRSAHYGSFTWERIT